MTNNVYWLLSLSINDGKLDEFKALADEMVEATKNESGALAYEWHLSDDDTACHLYERYADSAAAMLHLGNFGANFAPRFLACCTPQSFQVYGAADDAVRGALADFGAVHYGQLAGFAR